LIESPTYFRPTFVFSLHLLAASSAPAKEKEKKTSKKEPQTKERSWKIRGEEQLADHELCR